MKKLTYGVAAILFFILGCKETSSDSDGQQRLLGDSQSDTTTTLFAVPYDSALTNINRYDKKMREYDSLVLQSLKKKGTAHVPIRAFTVRAADLLEAMGLPATDSVKYDHVRIYFGMDANDGFKLYLTPVDSADLSSDPPKAGVDVILQGKYRGLGTDGKYVMDFAAPCPNTCP